MNIEDEIHAINKKLTELMTSITILKERRVNDKEDSDTLSKQVSDLAVAVNRLNLTIAKSEGKAEGVSFAVKTLRALIGGIVFVIIVGSGTLMFDMHTRLTLLEAGIK